MGKATHIFHETIPRGWAAKSTKYLFTDRHADAYPYRVSVENIRTSLKPALCLLSLFSVKMVDGVGSVDGVGGTGVRACVRACVCVCACVPAGVCACVPACVLF